MDPEDLERKALDDAFTDMIKGEVATYFGSLVVLAAYPADGTTGNTLDKIQAQFRRGLKLARQTRAETLAILAEK
jgi:hypothetical protein